jgi:hypothetical protein
VSLFSSSIFIDALFIVHLKSTYIPVLKALNCTMLLFIYMSLDVLLSFFFENNQVHHTDGGHIRCGRSYRTGN